MISERMQEILAVDLALLIVALLFYILLLLFREYQKVSHALERFSLSHQSIEDKLALLDENKSEQQDYLFDNDKLDMLITINSKIEEMFNIDLLDKNKQLHFHQREIQQLTKNLKASSAFIKKLKLMVKNNDAAPSKEDQEKLTKQSFLINNLRVKADKISIENKQLKQQLKKHLVEIKKMRERGEFYTKKLIQQGKELELLKAKSETQLSSVNNEELNQQIAQLNYQLTESTEELERISTEKEFLETQFLDILEQFEKNEKNDENEEGSEEKARKNILI